MADRIWRGDAVAVAQVVSVTPGDVVSGRAYSLNINGKLITVTAAGTTAAGLVTLLAAAINGSSIPEWREVVAAADEVDTGLLVLTSRTAGVPFAVTTVVGGITSDGSIVVTVSHGPTGGTWEFDAGVYGIADVTYNSSAASMQTQMDTLFGAGNTVVSKVIDGTDLVYTVLFQGTFGSGPVPAVDVSYSDLTGGDAAVEITTIQAARAGTTEVQTITLIGASGGTFAVGFKGVFTAALAYDIATAAMETALEGLSTVGAGNVSVAGTAGVEYIVTFAGTLDHVDVPPLEVDDTLLTAAKATVAETTPGVSGLNETQVVWIHQPAGNDEVFSLVRTGTVSGGTFTITYGGQPGITTLDYNCSAMDIADEINRLVQAYTSSQFKDVVVPQDTYHALTPDASSPIQFQLAGDYSHTQQSMYTVLAIASSLTGGGSLAFASVTLGTYAPTGLAFPSAGSDGMSLTFGGQTANVTLNDSSATVQAALEALSSIGAGNCSVTRITSSGVSSGRGYGVWEIEFTGTLGATNVALISTNFTGSATWSGASGTKYAGSSSGVNEVQTLSISGSPAAGEFDLTYGGQTTGRLPYNATAAQVQTALRVLSAIGATGVSCSGGALPGTPVVITFGGALSFQDVTLITARSYDMSNTVEITTDGVDGANEIQRLALTGQDVWGGTATLTWSGQTTGAIAYNASATAVEAALVALSNIAPGDVSCSGGPWPAAIDVEWMGAQLETDVAAITSTSSLINGVAIGESFDPLIAATTIRATGPNHWNEGVNWYNPASPLENVAPQRHDAVWITEGATDILYGLVQRVEFTVDTAGDYLIPDVDHDLNEGQIVEVWSSATLPAGLSAATAYYVVGLDAVTGKFKLSATSGGVAVNITDAGTGTHQVGVRLDRLFVAGRWGGTIGLPWTNESEYREYRPLYAVLGFNVLGTNGITIGQGDGSGSSRINIDTGTEPLALLEVLNTSGSNEQGIAAVNWLGDNSTTVVQVLGGDVGIALRAVETAEFGSLVLRGGSVGLGTVSFSTLDQTGGTLKPVNAATISGAVKVRG